MRFRCPACDQLLDLTDRPGADGACPRLRAGGPHPGEGCLALSGRHRAGLGRPEPRRRSRDLDDEDRPASGRLDVSLPPPRPKALAAVRLAVDDGPGAC